MRVLHVSPYFAPAFVYGGPPRSVLGLCRALQRAGLSIDVLTTTADGAGELPSAVTAAGTFEGVPVRYLPRTVPRRYFRAASLHRVLAEQGRAWDLVHLHGCWNVIVWEAAAWCRRAGIPYVQTPRGMLAPWSFGRSRARKWIAYRAFERPTLVGAARLHATSESERDDLLRLHLDRPIDVVPNGIDPAAAVSTGAIAAFRTRHGLRDDDVVVLYVGRLHPKKGLETLGDAFRQVAATRPRARLLVAGTGDADYAAALKRRFADLVGARTMILAGQLDGLDRDAAYAAADVFALISHSENFGLAVGEAMAAGLPVVVSRDCPWPQIERWKAGFWVDGTVAATAAALATLMDDGDLRRRAGANGRRETLAAFDWEAIADRMVKCYERAVTSASAIEVRTFPTISR